MPTVMKTHGISNVNRNPTEYAPTDETFNPTIHRVNNAVKMRAAHPDKPVPETPASLLRFSAPPEDLVEKVQSRIDSLIELAEIKKGTSSLNLAASCFSN
jgi:ATP-dependent DNA helicase 2 subunit 2